MYFLAEPEIGTSTVDIVEGTEPEVLVEVIPEPEKVQEIVEESEAEEKIEIVLDPKNIDPGKTDAEEPVDKARYTIFIDFFVLALKIA